MKQGLLFDVSKLMLPTVVFLHSLMSGGRGLGAVNSGERWILGSIQVAGQGTLEFKNNNNMLMIFIIPMQ